MGNDPQDTCRIFFAGAVFPGMICHIHLARHAGSAPLALPAVLVRVPRA